MNTVFLLAVGFCVYTYVIFPVALHYRARRRKPIEYRELDQWPSVSVVIAVHNEAEQLPGKLASLRLLDYPRDRLQIVFVSDGSTDHTVELLNQAKTDQDGWLIHHYDKAAGKPTALNVGVALSAGKILVFMDARQRISANAVKVLVSYLGSSEVGAVSGELVLDDDSGMEASNVGLYWRYEKWIRQNESRLFSTTGATGALYAIRSTDYVPHASDVLLDDFDTPIYQLKHRKRTLFAPEAQAFDRAEADAGDEFHRKVRTLAGNFQSFRRHPWLFNPSENPVWWQFLSHKVFRLLIPYALLLALVSALLGTSLFLHVMLIIQLIFYALGLLGLMGICGTQNKVVNFIKVFLQLNAAAAVGAARYFNGGAGVRWKNS